MPDEAQPGEHVRVTLLRPDGTVDDTRPPAWDRELRVSAELRYDRRDPVHGTLYGLPATYYPTEVPRDVEVRLRGGRDNVWAAIVNHTRLELDGSGYADKVRPIALDVWLPRPEGGWWRHTLPHVTLDVLATRERLAEAAYDRAWERRTVRTLLVEPDPEPTQGDLFALWGWSGIENPNWPEDVAPAGSPWWWRVVDELPADAPVEVP